MVNNNNVYDKEVWQIFVSFIGALISSALAVCSGVGGGSFFIAIYILILDLDAHYAIPLSKATIFGVGLAAFSVNYFKRHPSAKHRPLIDYDLTVMFEPITLCGTLVGVILNILFPVVLVIAPLCLLLAYTTYKTYKKGLVILAKERAAAQKALDDLQSIPLTAMGSTDDAEAAPISEHEEDQALKASIHQQEAAAFQPRPMTQLAIMWAAFMLTVCLLYAIAALPRCSPGWIVIFVLGVLVMGALTLRYRTVVMATTASKERLGMAFASGEVHWDARNTIRYPAYCFIVGLAASGLGVGGGLLSGPLMLALGVDPSVSAATSSFMIIFTSSSSTLQYLLLARLSLAPAALFCVAGFMGGSVGQHVVSHLVTKHRKQSALVFMLAGITLASGIAIVVVQAVSGGFSNTSFNPVCS